MKERIVQFMLLMFYIHFAIGCGTIIHGTTQDIQFSSGPDKAEVWIDGSKMGETPTKLNLKRKDEYLVTVKKEGYKDATVKIERSTSSWIIGNIIFGGIIGCGIDLITGGAYQLSPERVDVNLTEIATLDGKTILIGNERLDEINELRFLDRYGRPEVIVNITWVD